MVDAGSKLLKAGFTIPDQAPSMLILTQMKHILEDGPLIEGISRSSLTIIFMGCNLLESGYHFDTIVGGTIKRI